MPSTFDPWSTVQGVHAHTKTSFCLPARTGRPAEGGGPTKTTCFLFRLPAAARMFKWSKGRKEMSFLRTRVGMPHIWRRARRTLQRTLIVISQNGAVRGFHERRAGVVKSWRLDNVMECLSTFPSRSELQCRRYSALNHTWGRCMVV